ncbi:hypothetical protein, partial [Aggregatibacter actinomycetemcomitans]|uniref:hypothetical protein n=1 Tax=Aggregatibacter actinomycetemcomitans TaxID=714 RepID=UPI00197C696B
FSFYINSYNVSNSCGFPTRAFASISTATRELSTKSPQNTPNSHRTFLDFATGIPKVRSFSRAFFPFSAKYAR